MKLSNKQHTYHKNGFTLVEILVVIAIIATLTAIGYGTFLKLQESARENATELILNDVSRAMESRANNITSDQRTLLGLPNGDTYPMGGGDNLSTTALVNYISGDYDGDGVIDPGVTTESPQIVAESAANGSYLKDESGAWVITDSWGTPLRYTFPGVHNSHDDGFDLVSAGPDKVFGGDDDIILE